MSRTTLGLSRSDIAVARFTELFHRPKSIALSLEFLMSNQYTREIAAALLIDVSGNLLLQRRDNVPHIIQPGKVGLFGGHREGDETFLECVVREIAEEITQHIPAERFQHLFSLDGADPERPGGHLRGEFFISYGVQTDTLVVTEGKPLKVPPDAIWDMRSELTPATLLALNAFLQITAAG
ncbi:MAG: NUDIX hydrolase [Nitrobacter sp.]|uniref:NUDIX hydrolase n=1 Tax=Nitrobacter sp. TaxID=29420 RepID=UPI00261A3A94|nr:NUDIX hydrolase [Nitrobacter sp.]MCV0387485.1 NUDIX hydrolase [Nitrobacter sp.]